LNEPNDITFLEGKFYIADTNNHLIRIYNPVTDEVSTFTFKKAKPTPTPTPTEEPFYGKRIILPEKKISPNTKTLRFLLQLPEGCKWNKEAPNTIKVFSENSNIISIPSFAPGNKLFDYAIPISINGTGKTTVKIQVEAYYCEPPPQELCHPVAIEFSVPVIVDEKGTDTFRVTYSLGNK